MEIGVNTGKSFRPLKSWVFCLPLKADPGGVGWAALPSWARVGSGGVGRGGEGRGGRVGIGGEPG